MRDERLFRPRYLPMREREEQQQLWRAEPTDLQRVRERAAATQREEAELEP